MQELSQEALERIKRGQEVLELFNQYKAILHKSRSSMLPFNQEAINKMNDELYELGKKAWEEYGVDLKKYL